MTDPVCFAYDVIPKYDGLFRTPLKPPPYIVIKIRFKPKSRVFPAENTLILISRSDEPRVYATLIFNGPSRNVFGYHLVIPRCRSALKTVNPLPNPPNSYAQ